MNSVNSLPCGEDWVVRVCVMFASGLRYVRLRFASGSPQVRLGLTSLYGALRAAQQKLSLAGIARQACGAGELGTRFCCAPKLVQQIAAHAGQPGVMLERIVLAQFIHQFQPRRRAKRHAHSNGAV